MPEHTQTHSPAPTAIRGTFSNTGTVYTHKQEILASTFHLACGGLQRWQRDPAAPCMSKHCCLQSFSQKPCHRLQYDYAPSAPSDALRVNIANNAVKEIPRIGDIHPRCYSTERLSRVLSSSGSHQGSWGGAGIPGRTTLTFRKWAQMFFSYAL